MDHRRELNRLDSQVRTTGMKRLMNVEQRLEETVGVKAQLQEKFRLKGLKKRERWLKSGGKE